MKLRLFFAGLFGSGAILIAAKGDENGPTSIMFWILAIACIGCGSAAFEKWEKDRQ